MRVCVFNAKGGVGRTTLSLNLASWFAKRDPQSRVLLADCDPQGSALAWAALAEETEFTVGRSRSRGFDVGLPGGRQSGPLQACRAPGSPGPS